MVARAGKDISHSSRDNQMSKTNRMTEEEKKEKQRAYARQYYLTHKEEIKKNLKRYRERDIKMSYTKDRGHGVQKTPKR